jgi:ATP-dependent Clp protease ATP-binding subunit ClpX
VLATLEELSEEALVDILTTPKNSLVKQFAKLFEMDGVKLRFTQGGLRAIAHKAIARESGARGLRAILEEAMLDVMYEVPSKEGIKEVVVNEEAITKGEDPLIVYEKDEAHAG